MLTLGHDQLIASEIEEPQLSELAELLERWRHIGRERLVQLQRAHVAAENGADGRSHAHAMLVVSAAADSVEQRTLLGFAQPRHWPSKPLLLFSAEMLSQTFSVAAFSLK